MIIFILTEDKHKNIFAISVKKSNSHAHIDLHTPLLSVQV